jgi:hypothetical protein
MRLVGKLLDPSVIGPIPKAVGLYFKRLAQGLIVSVGPLLNSVISKAKETLEGEPDSFRNGLESSFLMSNLVELDSSKIVDSQVYDHIDEDIRNLLKKYFGTQRYLPIPENIISWQVGAAANPVFRMIRSPVTFGPALSPNPSWFPKPKE